MPDRSKFTHGRRWFTALVGGAALLTVPGAASANLTCNHNTHSHTSTAGSGSQTTIYTYKSETKVGTNLWRHRIGVRVSQVVIIRGIAFPYTTTLPDDYTTCYHF